MLLYVITHCIDFNPVQQQIADLTNIFLNLPQGIPGLKGIKVWNPF